MPIIILLSIFFSFSTAFASNKEPLALVQDVRGDVTVLRNPLRQKSLEFEKRVNSGVHLATAYLGWFWETYPIYHLSQLQYGDLIRTGAKSSVQMRIQSRHEITLSENSYVQIVPNFNQLLLKKVAEPSVYIIAGTMRIKVRVSSSPNELTARSASMIANIKGGDLLFAVKGKISQAISIGGDIPVRVSKEDQSLYSQSLEHYRSRNFRELSRLTALNLRQAEVMSAELSLGNKIEAWEPITQADQSNLARLLGLEKTRFYLEGAARFKATAVSESELNDFSDLLPDFQKIKEKMTFANITDEEIEEVLNFDAEARGDASSWEKQHSLISQEGPRYKPISIRLGYAEVRNIFEERYFFTGRSLALELEFRPWTHLYSYLAISSGAADAEKMANFLGQGAPQSLNSYSHLALGLGGQVILWKQLALSIGVGLISIQKMSIQYEDLPSNVNRIYTIALDPIPIIEIGVATHLVEDLELLLRYGSGSSSARVEAKDITDAYQAKSSLSYWTIGLGWRTR